ncbi:hypothetical protein VP01_15545g1, partial [Puccinia sorghi]
MSWPCFLNLLHFIEPDLIFYNQSQNPQQDVSIQLDVATCRLGYNGNGAAVLRLKNLFQFGYGTINLRTSRTLSMQAEGFPGCIGFVDGTTITL